MSRRYVLHFSFQLLSLIGLIHFSFTFIQRPRTKFVDLFQNFNNINEITRNAATTLLFVTTSFRMINFYWNRMRYVNMVKVVDGGLSELMRSNDAVVTSILSTSIKNKRNLTASFWIIALITGNLMCVNTAVQALFIEHNDARRLILSSWFPFDSRNHFWLCYVIQYFIMNIGMVIVPCWHSFIVSIMVFVIMRLKLLNHELCKIDGSSAAQLVKCVNERQKLVDFVTELSSLISSSIFLDFVVFSVLLCALLFQATQVNNMAYVRHC